MARLWARFKYAGGNLAAMSAPQKVAVVTGSSSGIGHAAAVALANNGFLTFATMRDLGKRSTIDSAAKGMPDGGKNLRVVQLDVTDDSSVKNAAQSIVSESGRIDVLVNNAGFGVMGAFEDVSIEELRKQFETNVFGAVRVTQAILPTMRKQRSGRIINMSSGAGRLGYPGGSAYIASKFALEGISESLAYEADFFGIQVSLIEPGFIRTNFGNGMILAKKAQDTGSPYLQMMHGMSSFFDKAMENASPPELVADLVVEAATASKPKLRYLAGKDVEQWVGARNSMSDDDFFAMIKQGMMPSSG